MFSMKSENSMIPDQYIYIDKPVQVHDENGQKKIMVVHQ